MSAEIVVPALGESIVEATVGKWLKQAGETVTTSDVLVELETDKVNVEIRAPQAGVLESIDRPDGTTVAVGEVLGRVGAAAVASAAPQPAASAPAASVPAASSAAEPASAQNGSGAPPAAPARVPNATPTAVNVASGSGVDVAAIAGSGPSGRVMKQDVVSAAPAPSAVGTQRAASGAASPAAPTSPPAAAAVPSPAAPSANSGREERVRLSRRRQTIAKRLVEAQRTAAMLTTFNEVDMTAVMDLRKRRGEAFLKAHGVKLGFMSFFVKAVVGALKFQPRLNAEIQGDEIVLKRYYDIGIAVAAEEGLVVPVLRGADALGFAAIEKSIGDLGKRARENTLGLQELQGGTFTITNGGIFGSLMSTPILNAPQVGILGMHAIKERPIVVDGAIQIRPMMYLALSYDHRIVDGSEAVRFLVRVKELIEDPESLLLDA